MPPRHPTSTLSPDAPWSQRGFTLIELLVTIAIGTTLMMVAVPSFVDFQRNSRLSDAVSSFISAANAARANAMKQGLNTYLVPLSGSGTDWSSGWMVYADTNWNQVYDPGVDTLIMSREAPGADVTLVPSVGSSLAASPNSYLLFNGSGYPRLLNGGFGAGTMVMSNVSPRSSSIIIDASGRLRSCKTGTTGC